MSSRNAYLSAAERVRAVALHESLDRAVRMWRAGDGVEVIERAMRETLQERGIAVDYAVVVDPESLVKVADPAAPAVALVAGRLGSTRLIDNRQLPGRGTPH